MVLLPKKADIIIDFRINQIRVSPVQEFRLKSICNTLYQRAQSYRQPSSIIDDRDQIQITNQTIYFSIGNLEPRKDLPSNDSRLSSHQKEIREKYS